MSTRFVMLDRIKSVEEKTTQRFVHSFGKDAVFEDESQGWWAVFESCPASMYLGHAKPGLRAGDKVRIILEQVE